MSVGEELREWGCSIDLRIESIVVNPLLSSNRILPAITTDFDIVHLSQALTGFCCLFDWIAGEEQAQSHPPWRANANMPGSQTWSAHPHRKAGDEHSSLHACSSVNGY